MRDENNDKIRNTKIENYIDGINYLAQNNFEVLIFSNQKFDFDNQCIKFFNLNNKKKNSDIFYNSMQFF